MQSGLADFDVKGFDDALLKQGTSVHSPLEFLLLGTGRSTHQIFLSIIVAWQLKLQISSASGSTGSTMLNQILYLLVEDVLPPHEACSSKPESCLCLQPWKLHELHKSFARRTSNKKMMMSWYPKQPDITSFKWMFGDFQPFPFLKIWKKIQWPWGFHSFHSLHSHSTTSEVPIMSSRASWHWELPIHQLNGQL